MRCVESLDTCRPIVYGYIPYSRIHFPQIVCMVIIYLNHTFVVPHTQVVDFVKKNKVMADLQLNHRLHVYYRRETWPMRGGSEGSLPRSCGRGPSRVKKIVWVKCRCKVSVKGKNCLNIRSCGRGPVRLKIEILNI